MLTKSQIQFLRSLHDKAGRKESGYFLVEGRKGIHEFLDSDFEIVEGFFTEKFVDSFQEKLSIPYVLIGLSELGRVSTLASNDAGLLVVQMRGDSPHDHPLKGGDPHGLTLILDGINDPGNLGTIIRTADWYGVKNIICSSDTVDCYNPKVVIATMGSLVRVRVEYRNLREYLLTLWDQKIYGAYLDGENIRTKKFVTQGSFLVIGSESHGIRPDIEEYITDRITIPRFGGAESLNAGVATGIILERMI